MKLTEQALRLNLRSGRPDLPAIILVSDVQRLPDPAAAMRHLPRGSAVLVRHPDAAARRALAERLLRLARAKRLRVIISDDLVLARRLKADGLHLPEARAAGPSAPAIRRAWRGRILTVAAHSPAALRRAELIGGDAAILSPVFPTASHPGRNPIGLLRLSAWARASKVPIYAMGGMTAPRAAEIRSCNVVGIAAIGGLVIIPQEE